SVSSGEFVRGGADFEREAHVDRSWTLYESITFDRTRITSRDWSSYPILRFSAVPDSVEVDVIDRPGQPFLGTGEAAPASEPVAREMLLFRFPRKKGSSRIAMESPGARNRAGPSIGCAPGK